MELPAKGIDIPSHSGTVGSVALDTYWTIVALVVGATAAAVVIAAWRRPRTVSARLLVAGVLVSALGWLASAAYVFAAPARHHEVVAVAVVGLAAIGCAGTSGGALAGPAAEQVPIRWGLPVAIVSVALVTTAVRLLTGGRPDVVSAVLGVLTGFTLVVRQALALTDA